MSEKKSLKIPLIILAVVLLAIVVALVMAKTKGCPVPVPAGRPADPAVPVTAPVVKEEPKKVEETKAQPVDAGSTGPVIDRPEGGLRVGHL